VEYLVQSITLVDLRLFVHVCGAIVWVGGQVVWTLLLPVLRPLGGETVRAVARRLSPVLWGAFALLVASGVWNLIAIHPGNQGSAYQTTLALKLGVVVISGGAAFVHTRVATARARGIWGAVSGVTALAAVLLGVVLAG
jgi:putative copper export protein